MKLSVKICYGITLLSCVGFVYNVAADAITGSTDFIDDSTRLSLPLAFAIVMVVSLTFAEVLRRKVTVATAAMRKESAVTTEFIQAVSLRFNDTDKELAYLKGYTEELKKQVTETVETQANHTKAIKDLVDILSDDPILTEVYRNDTEDLPNKIELEIVDKKTRRTEVKSTKK